MLKTIGIAAVLFGGLTLFSGGMALFGGAAARQAVGNAVDFVLWFNFLAGAVYIVAGVGLIRRAAWAAQLSFALAAATLAVFIAFGFAVAAGSAFELRTAGAMVIRTAFWAFAAAVACRSLGCLSARSR